MDSRLPGLLNELDAASTLGDYPRFLELLDRHYVKASAEAREDLRALVTGDETTEELFLEQLAEVSRHADAAKDHLATLRVFLLGVSLGSRYDSRDMLMSLAAMWRWAEKQGIDPLPLYREFAEISDSEVNYMVGGSAQAMISRIAEDASYRERLK
jgi:hypothetical protein